MSDMQWIGEPSIHSEYSYIQTKKRGYGPGNRNGYSNAEVDKLIEDGRASWMCLRVKKIH